MRLNEINDIVCEQPTKMFLFECECIIVHPYLLSASTIIILESE